MHECLLITAAQLSDEALLARVIELAGRERGCTAELVAHLAELEARKIGLGQGRSLYLYCTDVLRLSEHAAYNRIGAARAACRFPVILDLLADGSVNVTTVTLLAPRLTDENHLALLREATHRKKDEVKEIVRRLDPLPPARTVIRAAAPPPPSREPATAAAPSAPAAEAGLPLVMGSSAPASVEPRAPELFRMHVDIDRETRDVVRRLQDLLARETGGDISRIAARAFHALLADVERGKLAATSKPRDAQPPREGSRHIPAAVRRAVWRRDEGRCAFVGAHGRCPERRYLEWHHVIPHAHQGPATVANISMRCRAHNQYEAEQTFGRFEPMVARETGPRYGAQGLRELGLDRVRKVTAAAVGYGSMATGSRSSRGTPRRPVPRSRLDQSSATRNASRRSSEEGLDLGDPEGGLRARYRPPSSYRGIGSRSGSKNRPRAASEKSSPAE